MDFMESDPGVNDKKYREFLMQHYVIGPCKVSIGLLPALGGGGWVA